MAGKSLAAALAASIALAAAPGGADPVEPEILWVERDWAVQRAPFRGAMLCTAWTGGGDWPLLRLDLVEGASADPARAAALRLEAPVEGRSALTLADGAPLLFLLDSGGRYAGRAEAATDGAGRALAIVAAEPAETPGLLAAMRDASALALAQDGQMLTMVSLAGFRAAWSQLAARCAAPVTAEAG